MLVGPVSSSLGRWSVLWARQPLRAARLSVPQREGAWLAPPCAHTLLR
jgi:hypothetical protein